ncbi:amidohydrolase family protein [Foetidibacter luteolus]|uniref:amidohydrolase family protein n=1 Tax=Foetidibacter luteolus TaxID=2608880 RepID=UPI001F48584A|nr:amidohydrolase family protein [Foetidibacter luteolus]
MLKAFGQAPTKTDSLILNADTLIERLNRAKFNKAWILSNAYWYGSPFTPVENEYEEVKKQNDWTAAQAARYADRLAAFMSVNPLKPYALKEIERCADSKHFTGLKLHFANSKVNLFDKAHVSQLQKVFALANENRLVLFIHFRNAQDWNGKTNAEIFVKHLAAFAKETKIVIAHLGGWGNYDKPTDEALKVMVTYMHKNGAGGNNLYFDLSAVLPANANEGRQPAEGKGSWNAAAALPKRIGQIGLDHILFGTDWPLIDIDPYTRLLESALGTPIVREILRNTVPVDAGK